MPKYKESFKRRLLAGERSAPPEACGGTPGYERMVHYVETGEDLYDEDPDALGGKCRHRRRLKLGARRPEFRRGAHHPAST